MGKICDEKIHFSGLSKNFMKKLAIIVKKIMKNGQK